MTMTVDDEEAFIKRELAWCTKNAEDKYAEVEIATRRWKEAKFRADITQKALDEFYINNPKEQNDDNTN